MEPSEKQIEDACKILQAALDEVSPASVKLLAYYDQIRAECRDDPVKRQAVIDVLMAESTERIDAEEWVDKRED